MSAFSNFTITIPVPVSQGGTAAITAAAARTALGTAASGANADITGMSAVTAIQMGGATASFPAINRNSDRLFFQLADGSGFCVCFGGFFNALGTGGSNSFISKIIVLSSDGIGINFIDATSAHPALKCSSTVLQARLGDDSNFAPLQGLLRTAANAVTGLTGGVLAATTNASIVITDASGQAYRIPCII